MHLRSKVLFCVPIILCLMPLIFTQDIQPPGVTVTAAPPVIILPERAECPINCACTVLNSTYVYRCPPGYMMNQFLNLCVHQCPILDYYTAYKHSLSCEQGFTFRNNTCFRFLRDQEIVCPSKPIKCCYVEFPRKCDQFSGACYQRSYHVCGPLCASVNGTITDNDVQKEIQGRYQYLCSGANSISLG